MLVTSPLDGSDLPSSILSRCRSSASRPGPLMVRAYELRSNLTPYDATYVALAEGLSCALVSADARLARAPGIHCHVDILVF